MEPAIPPVTGPTAESTGARAAQIDATATPALKMREPSLVSNPAPD
jgi:hypothetical protein